MEEFGTALTCPAALAERVAEEAKVWARVVRCRDTEGLWYVRALELTAGEPPSRWSRARWVYPDAVFDAMDVSGEDIAAWLRTGQVDVDDAVPAAESMNTRLNWRRYPSGAIGEFEPVSWPTAEAAVFSVKNMDPHGPLLSDATAPSFTTFQVACAQFLGLAPRLGGVQLPSSAVFRWQDARVRLNRVRIRPDELVVEIEGDDLYALTVELAGDAPGEQRRISAPSSARSKELVQFSLPTGLPAGAWIVVRRGSTLLDRRNLTWPWSSPTEVGVEVELPAQDKIDAYVAGRESDVVEFKRQVPADDSAKAKVMKTVSAFANGMGGVVLFGVDDDYNLTGIPSSQAARQIDQLGQVIRSWIDPTPACEFNLLEIPDSGQVIIELTVRSGDRLYGCSRPNESSRFYVRHHARTVPARVGEVEEIVHRRQVAPASMRLPRA
jgi:hypothetical protein